jgi:hypothetical protein
VGPNRRAQERKRAAAARDHLERRNAQQAERREGNDETNHNISGTRDHPFNDAAASAEDCDLQRAHWVCVPNQEPGAIQQFLDRFHQTMDRALTPPGGWRQDTAVPPESVPQDSRLAPQEQWRKAIIAEAERFCAAYPNDPVCHFKDPGPGGATPAR